MRRFINKMIKEFELHWKNYVFQSLFATLVIFIVLLCLDLRHAVVIASIGATAFIVFAMPSSITAQTRNVIGGQVIGLIIGSLCPLLPHTTHFHTVIVYSLAVGATMFVMVVTDTEHPPAAGTALGIAIVGFSFDVAFIILVSVIILSLVHYLFRKHLRDLT